MVHSIKKQHLSSQESGKLRVFPGTVGSNVTDLFFRKVAARLAIGFVKEARRSARHVGGVEPRSPLIMANPPGKPVCHEEGASVPGTDTHEQARQTYRGADPKSSCKIRR